ncbi:hypothetical protein EV426DRAFT_668251 [Tirmania nivea]|nr:hypothetical protein EV426DRAFT_668251 [Tirmania nivea]
MNQNSVDSKPCFEFGYFPGGGVSLYEKPPCKQSPRSEQSGTGTVRELDQKQNMRTRSVGEVDYKDELDLDDEFGVHSEGYTDTDQYGFPTPLSFKAPIWHSKQPSGKLETSPHSSNDPPPFEDNVIGKQLVSMNGSPLSQAANVMQPIDIGYPHHYGQHKYETCRAETGCDTPTPRLPLRVTLRRMPKLSKETALQPSLVTVTGTADALWSIMAEDLTSQLSIIATGATTKETDSIAQIVMPCTVLIQ